jgi:glc operon protein GlcG
MNQGLRRRILLMPSQTEIPKIFEDGIELMHLNSLLAFDRVIASRDGVPLIDEGTTIGTIGCSGGTDSQDEIVSKVGAAVTNQLQATNK